MRDYTDSTTLPNLNVKVPSTEEAFSFLDTIYTSNAVSDLLADWDEQEDDDDYYRELESFRTFARG